MTTYIISSPHFSVGLVVAVDTVVQAPPVLKWTVGQSFIKVRDYCRKRGWTIEPTIDNYQPQWLEYEGRAYELHWSKGTLKRITEHGEEIRDLTYDQVPEVLKGLIYGNDE